MPSISECEQDTIATLKDLTEGWDSAATNNIQTSTSIINDLGFESLDVVYLVSAIEQRYGRRDLPFERLLMTEGRYVDDLNVHQIAQFLHQNL